MSTKSLSLIAAISSLFAAANASAQQDPPVPAEQQPQPPTVSQINGQLVPVGNHNEYVYEFKKWNVSTNPLGWVLGSYGVSLSYALSDHVAIRGDINYYHPVDTHMSGYELGVGVPIYFRRTYSGIFLEPGIIVRSLHDDRDEYYGDGYGGGDAETNTGPQVLVGWHWTWDSGLNVAVAAGVGREWSSRDEDEYGYSTKEPVFFNGYLRFGYSW